MIHVHVSGRVPQQFPVSLASKAVEATFRKAKQNARGAVGIRFVSESEITSLNDQYRKKRKPTDVLSFSAQESAFPVGVSSDVEWGDIFICSSYARREADRRGILFQEELVRLISHGMLHLLGYDHATEADEHRMFGLQEDVVQRVASHL